MINIYIYSIVTIVYTEVYAARPLGNNGTKE